MVISYLSFVLCYTVIVFGLYQQVNKTIFPPISQLPTQNFAHFTTELTVASCKSQVLCVVHKVAAGWGWLVESLTWQAVANAASAADAEATGAAAADAAADIGCHESDGYSPSIAPGDLWLH